MLKYRSIQIPGINGKNTKSRSPVPAKHLLSSLKRHRFSFSFRRNGVVLYSKTHSPESFVSVLRTGTCLLTSALHEFEYTCQILSKTYNKICLGNKNSIFKQVTLNYKTKPATMAAGLFYLKSF